MYSPTPKLKYALIHESLVSSPLPFARITGYMLCMCTQTLSLIQYFNRLNFFKILPDNINLLTGSVGKSYSKKASSSPYCVKLVAYKFSSAVLLFHYFGIVA